MPFLCRSRRISLSAILVWAASLAGWQANCRQPVHVHVSDDYGRVIELASPPRRIISLAPSSTEILFELGVGDRIVGVDTASDYPPEARRIKNVGNFAEPNLEKVVSLRPDLIVMVSVTASRTIADELERRVGCPVFASSPKRLNDVPAAIEKLGRLVFKAKEGKQLAVKMRQQFQEVRARVAKRKPVRLLLEISSPPSLIVVGRNNFIDDAITLAGGTNVVKAARPFPLISLETLASLDPEAYIIATGHIKRKTSLIQEVRRRSGFASLRAVSDGRVHAILADHLLRPSPRIVRGIAELARLLHPEAFRR